MNNMEIIQEKKDLKKNLWSVKRVSIIAIFLA